MPEKDFFQRVYELCRTIPYGKVTTYGELAKAVGSPGASRMVGCALNKSTRLNPPVPAHRVLNRDGMLTGKKAFFSPSLMEELLVQEGHQVENDQLLDFKESLWIPQNKEGFGL